MSVCNATIVCNACLTSTNYLILTMSSRSLSFSCFLLCSAVWQGQVSVTAKKQYHDVPCEWSSLAGVSFDLKALTKAANQQSYYIKDGDIPCTPEEEPTFSYVWNFCDKVTSISYPDKSVCDESVEQGAVLQYIDRADGYKECHVIGRYDASNDDLFYNLLSEKNPALGVSMTYPMGRCCDYTTMLCFISYVMSCIMLVWSEVNLMNFQKGCLVFCPNLFCCV